MKKIIVIFIYAFLLTGCDWINNWVGYDNCYPLAWLPEATVGEPYRTEINTGLDDLPFFIFNVRDKNNKWQSTKDTGLQWQYTDRYNNPEVADITLHNITIHGIPEKNFAWEYVRVDVCLPVIKSGFIHPYQDYDCQPKYCLKINSDKDKENL